MSGNNSILHLVRLSACCTWCIAAACWPLARCEAQASGETTAGIKARGEKLTLAPADADGDGKVTRAEWGGLMQRFSQLDANHDGGVDRPELLSADASAEFPVLLKLADADGDGKLTRAEWKRMAQSFRRLDANHDSVLELDELTSVAAATAAAAKAIRNAPTLNGVWHGWIVEGRGENPNAGTEIELLISGANIAGREVKPALPGTSMASQMAGLQSGPAPDLGVGTLTMTGNGSFGLLDAMYTAGPHAGRVCLGMYRLEGDVLYWCVSNRTGQRPDFFATANGCWLMILRRQTSK